MNANAVTNTEPLTDSVLGFRVGAWGFILPVSIHCEVLERLHVNPIPNVEPWLSGLLNVRGLIVPVIDLHLWLGMGSLAAKERRLFTIGRGDKTMAVWIDGYPQLLSEQAQSFVPIPPVETLPPALLPFVAQCYSYHGEIWLKAQFDSLFRTLGQHQSRQETVS